MIRDWLRRDGWWAMSDEKIIQAAARALLSATDGCTCIADDFTDDECLFHRVKAVQHTMAHSVIRIIEPRIREQIAKEIRDQREDFLNSPGLNEAWVAGWHSATDHHAAKIARGDHHG